MVIQKRPDFVAERAHFVLVENDILRQASLLLHPPVDCILVYLQRISNDGTALRSCLLPFLGLPDSS